MKKRDTTTLEEGIVKATLVKTKPQLSLIPMTDFSTSVEQCYLG